MPSKGKSRRNIERDVARPSLHFKPRPRAEGRRVKHERGGQSHLSCPSRQASTDPARLELRRHGGRGSFTACRRYEWPARLIARSIKSQVQELLKQVQLHCVTK
jgi:hypothetical protein